MGLIGMTFAFGGLLYASPKPPELANDLGPDTLDVSAYPPEIQTAYKKFEQKCSVCHSAARSLNSELVTMDDWSRYIKRMWLRPPCCSACPVITKTDALTIRKFLVYDSKIRKTGANAAAWAKHRQALLAEFKAKYPAKYEQDYGPTEQKGSNLP